MLLLTGVFRGTVFAVEGAATVNVALVAATLASRAGFEPRAMADGAARHARCLAVPCLPCWWAHNLQPGISPGGARTAGSAGTGAGLQPASPAPAALVLTLVALCAWVLDAFEMIFVIIPIMAPPLIILLGDAQQAAVLLLLVLRLSF